MGACAPAATIRGLRKDDLRHASWQELLASPARASHIVQIYDNDEFLASGVALFAAEGLQRGEAVLLTGTEAHLRAVRRALAEKNVDCDGAIRRGQLSTHDVQRTVEAVLSNGMPDAARYDAMAGAALARAKAGYSAVRWWGESGNYLHL